MTAGAAPFTPSPDNLRAFAAFLDAGRLPGPLEELVEGYIAVKTSKPVDDPAVLERLRRAVVAQKSGYWKAGENRRISYRSGYSVLAYLAYQFPVYYVQSCRLLARLAVEGHLSQKMRVVDLGTGPGVIPLAMVTLGRYLPGFSAEVIPVEPSEEHLEACRHLVRGFREADDAVRVRPALPVDAATVADAEIPDEIDILVLSNLLNELSGAPAAKAATVMRWASRLSENGTVLLVEPADLENATGLREVQRELLGAGLHLRHPCWFLWGSSCGPVPCWSFEEAPAIRPTRLQEALATGAPEPYRYRNTDIKFAAAVLG
ncbi:MAG: class I SAM-dependent methyltransferase, partial [Methanospirillum sp.]